MQNVQLSVKRFKESPHLQLAAVLLASLIIYFLVFLLPANLLNLYDQPRLDRDLLFYQGPAAYIRLALAFIGVWILYWIGYRISLKIQGRNGWIIIITGMLAIIAVLLFMAPFDAADIYDNIIHGRILGVYDANPFQQVIADYPDDPFYEYAAWKNVPSAYGPVWEILAGITARLIGNGIIANVMAFKILPGIFHLAGVVVIVLYLRRETPEKSLSGAFLLGLNPMILYETWGHGHNDMAMAFWFLVAAWFIYNQRFTLASLALLVGALIKFIPILLIPGVLILAWRNLESMRLRFLFIVRTGILSLLAIVATYYPFGAGFGSLTLERRMQMFSTSIPASLYHLLIPTLGKSEAARLVSLGALMVLTVFVLYQSFRKVEKKPSDHFIQTTFNILAFYLMVTCLWFQQWYSLWLLCLVPLLSRDNRHIALFFGFWLLNKQLVFSPIFIPTIHFLPETAIRLVPLYTLVNLGVPLIFMILILIRRRMRKQSHAQQ
ncbi:hypothetical protein ACFLTX_03065 [Chloroflexota bacterium]